MDDPGVSSGRQATASDCREYAETSRAVLTSAQGVVRKRPPSADSGAKPIEWSTPSRPSTWSRTRSASNCRSDVDVTSSSITADSAGSRDAVRRVSDSARPKEVSTTVAPCSWASRATWKAID